MSQATNDFLLGLVSVIQPEFAGALARRYRNSRVTRNRSARG